MRKIFLFLLMLPAAAYSETLRVPLVSLPAKIVPAEILEVSDAVVANHMFEGLFCYDPSNNLVPGLLESFRISPDGVSYSFKVRRGIKFSDGSPLTAAAVRESLENSIRVLGVASGWAFGMVDGFTDFVSGRRQHLRGVSVVSEYVLELRLNNPYAPILQVFVSPYFRISKAVGDGVIGTGPYYLAERDKDSITLKVLSWRMKESDISEIIFEKVGSKKNMVTPERLKRYDVIEILSPWKVDTDRHNAVDFPYLQANLLLLNTSKEVFSVKVERQRFLNLIRNNIDFARFGWQPTSAGFPFAKNLFKNKPANLSEKDGSFTAPVTVYYSDSVSVFDEEAIKDLENKIVADGGRVSFVRIPITELVRKFSKSEYEAAFLGYVPDIIDPDGLFYPLLGTGQQYNFMKYSSGKVDDMLNRGRTESDPVKRFQIYSELTNYIYNDAPMGFLGSTKGRMLISKKYDIPQVNSLGLPGFQLNTLKLRK